MLLLCLALQVSAVPLENLAVENDGISPYHVRFSPDGQSLFVPHNRSLSHVKIDVPTRTPLLANRSGVELVYGAAVDASGTTVVYAERFTFGTRRASDLQPTGSVDSPFGISAEVALDLVGQRAVFHDAVDDTGTAVVDLATMTIERQFNSASPDDAFIVGRGLAADNITYVSIGNRRIHAYDVTTGQRTASQPFPGTDTFGRIMAITGDRTRAVVLTEDRSTTPRSIVLETYQLPSLTPIASLPTPLTGPYLDSGLSLDAAGTRAILSNGSGAWSVDLATGASVQFTAASASGAVLSVDGAYASMLHDNSVWVYDATTGASLFSANRFGVIERSPTESLFAVTSLERVMFLEVLAGGTVQVDDISTSAAADVDGPFFFTELSDGKSAAVIGSAGDDLLLIDLEQNTVASSVAVDREPTDVAQLGDGSIAVTHGASASLVAFDSGSLAVTSRTPLPGRSTQVVAAGGTLAWVQVRDLGIRSLELVDTAAASIVASVPLTPAEERDLPLVSELQDDVVFDMARGRAFALAPAEGRIEMVDLATQAVVDVGLLMPGLGMQVFVSPDGARLTALTTMNEVVSWTVNGSGLTPSWSYSCMLPASAAFNSALGHQSADGSRYFFAFQNNTQGICPLEVLFDAVTGGVLPLASPLSSGPVRSYPMERDERWSLSGSLMGQFRFDGDEFGFFILPGTASVNYNFRSVERSSTSGKTLAIARAPGGSTEFLILDPLASRRTEACSPAVPNSTGVSSTLDIQGGGLVRGTMVATVRGLEPNAMAGYLLVADTLTSPMPAAGSVGSVCIGGSIGRYVDQVQLADASGEQRYSIDLELLPLSATGPTAAAPGETWVFQAWHRDMTAAGTPTSNFSPAVAVEIQ